jgi:hypothetical protein
MTITGWLITTGILLFAIFNVVNAWRFHLFLSKPNPLKKYSQVFYHRYDGEIFKGTPIPLGSVVDTRLCIVTLDGELIEHGYDYEADVNDCISFNFTIRGSARLSVYKPDGSALFIRDKYDLETIKE